MIVVAALAFLAVPARCEDWASLVLARLAVSPDDGPSRDLVRQALSKAVATPTGRALAADFVALRSSAAVTLRQRADLGASPAETDVWHGMPTIRIDPEPAGDFPWFLAHELFGHVLRDLQARRAGVESAYGIYEGNELEASLAGWLIASEAGQKPGDSASQFLRDPKDFRSRLEVSATLYAGALPLDAMQDPIPTLRRRRARCDAYLKKIDAVLKKPALSEAKRADYTRSKILIGRTAGELDELIAHYSRADGRGSLEAISKSMNTKAGKRFFAEAESRLRDLTRRMLRSGRGGRESGDGSKRAEAARRP